MWQAMGERLSHYLEALGVELVLIVVAYFTGWINFGG